jgi:hypothetical protein
MILFNSKRKKEKFQHTYYQGDLFIAEFPKSGVTWVTTILATLEEIYLNHDYECSKALGFGELYRYISDDSLQIPLSSYRFHVFGGRVVKTHNCWGPQNQRCIYLYRHPGKVMASYWLMLKSQSLINKNMTLEEFCFHKDYGLSAWKKHINSWLYASSPSAVIFFLSYEELLAQASTCIQNICDTFSSAEIGNSLVNRAVQASSRDKMIEAESFMLKHDIRKKFKNKEDYAFVGKQDRGESLAKSIYSLVETMCKEEISILYPSDLSI